ncbi:outer membrane protein assembly factor BamD [Phnomibacter sp. MR]|uniref:outer membrane protein assembly factor BamD n=1 Tax=Phnomibacter sp. MR TaxID=3042318 RepID=UPI003A80F419|nr:outer membrane protein assembly factor BamD [Chitinophagaceae bacterium]
MRFLVSLFLSAVVLVSCSDVGKILKSSDYNMKLAKANEYYDAKKYTQAQLIYEDVMPVIKGSAEYENTYYKWAYCHYNQKDYLNAENLFKGFFENFPNSSRAEEAEFMRAFCYYKQSPKPELDQTTTMKAITHLQTFANTHSSSPKAKEALQMIEELRRKLEIKDFKSAELYYQLGYFRASATAFTELLNNYPDSDEADKYKLMVIRSWFKYAENSYTNKQEERFETVLNECADFTDRFPDSKLGEEVVRYKTQSQNIIKSIKDEQTQASTKR